jgi:hypothetical protein
MILGFVTSASFHGSENNSPFNFKPFDIESVQAIVGGRRFPTEKQLELNIGENIFSEAYFQFLNNSGFGDTIYDTNGITLDKYKKHCFFLAFDFRSDYKEDDESIDFTNYGETRIFIRFRAALAQPIHIIAYLNFDNILRIDSGRNAVMDHTV